MGSVGKKGYGKLWYDGGCKSAHKIAYFLHYNYYPTSEEHVLHKCDTLECVNPKHLFLGDNFINQRDCVEKGRHSSQKGGNHNRRKLELEQIVEIKKRLKDGEYYRDLTKEFGVSHQTIHAIKSERNWKNV